MSNKKLIIKDEGLQEVCDIVKESISLKTFLGWWLEGHGDRYCISYAMSNGEQGELVFEPFRYYNNDGILSRIHHIHFMIKNHSGIKYEKLFFHHQSCRILDYIWGE